MKLMIFVVYFNQQIGAWHAVCWSKSVFLVLNKVFPTFFVTNEKKEEKMQKITGKTCIKGDLPIKTHFPQELTGI